MGDTALWPSTQQTTYEAVITWKFLAVSDTGPTRHVRRECGGAGLEKPVFAVLSALLGVFA